MLTSKGYDMDSYLWDCYFHRNFIKPDGKWIEIKDEDYVQRRKQLIEEKQIQPLHGRKLLVEELHSVANGLERLIEDEDAFQTDWNIIKQQFEDIEAIIRQNEGR